MDSEQKKYPAHEVLVDKLVDDIAVIANGKGDEKVIARIQVMCEILGVMTIPKEHVEEVMYKIAFLRTGCLGLDEAFTPLQELLKTLGYTK